MKISSTPASAPVSPSASAADPAPCRGRFRIGPELSSEPAAAAAPPRPAGPLSPGAPGPVESGARRLVARMLADEQAVDRGLRAAMSGRQLSAQELIVLQAKVIQYSQELDVASRVVEKGTSAVKQILTTQV